MKQLDDLPPVPDDELLADDLEEHHSYTSLLRWLNLRFAQQSYLKSWSPAPMASKLCWVLPTYLAKNLEMVHQGAANVVGHRLCPSWR